MSTRTEDRPRQHGGEGPCPFMLSGVGDQVTIQGQAEWISEDQAYVVVPLGTARSLRQCWNATAYVPDEREPGRSQELRMRAQLVSAQARFGLEGDSEGLLLRLTRVGDGRGFGLVNALPPA